MNSLVRRCAMIGLCLVVGGESAWGGQFSDPSGFSFTYPDGWMPVTGASLRDAQLAMPAEIKDLIAKSRFDFNQMSVVLLRIDDGKDEEFVENLNVIVQGQQIPVEQASVTKLTGMFTEQYRALGIPVKNLQGRIQKIGNRGAVVIEYEAQMPGAADLLRQKQVAMPGGGKTFFITCTAKASSFDSYRALFDQILASFQAPAPVAQGFDFKRTLVMGLVGGIVGGLIGIGNWLKNRSSKKSAPGPEAGGPIESGSV